MEVFVIPVGSDRYELYCEVPDEDPVAGREPPRGFFRGLLRRFREALAEVERERRHHAPQPGAEDRPRTLYQRVKRATLRRIAERIAEQRLLWHLRRQHAAIAWYPADIDADRGLQILRKELATDYDCHRRWLVIDGILLVLSGVLVILPGPNVIAYYLAFRLVGHYLSMRGAREGLDTVQWELRSSDALAELRPLIALEPEVRGARVSEIAGRLRLEHLPRFFERLAVPSA
jgi:K+-H+ exchange-related protein